MFRESAEAAGLPEFRATHIISANDYLVKEGYSAENPEIPVVRREKIELAARKAIVIFI